MFQKINLGESNRKIGKANTDRSDNREASYEALATNNPGKRAGADMTTL